MREQAGAGVSKIDGTESSRWDNVRRILSREAIFWLEVTGIKPRPVRQLCSQQPWDLDPL